MENVYLLIDIENVSIKKRREALIHLRDRLTEDGYEVYKAGLASKSLSQIEEWEGMILNTFQIAKQNVMGIKTSSGYDSADMTICFMAGLWCKENEVSRYPMIILSNDKILKSIEDQIQSLGIKCLQYDLNPDKFKKEKKTVPIEFRKDKYPFNYTTVQLGIPSFLVITYPKDTDYPISSIPIPNIGEEFSIGSSHGDTHEDTTICLDYWDQGMHTLYPIHVYVGYKEGEVYVRSAKGHRTGQHAVERNGVLIESSMGNIVLSHGDIIRIGGFLFRVNIPRSYSEREIVSLDDTSSTIKNAEILLHQWIRNVLKASNDNWWDQLVRKDIQAECNARNNSTFEHSYNYTFLRDLDKIIADNWGLFDPMISPYYMSKGSFRKALSKFMMIRNKEMHPTREKLADDEVEFISAFLFTLQQIIH